MTTMTVEDLLAKYINWDPEDPARDLASLKRLVIGAYEDGDFIEDIHSDLDGWMDCSFTGKEYAFLVKAFTSPE